MHWLARGESGIPEGIEWLTEREAERAAAMRYTKRRTEYLLRRWAGKCAVAAVVGMSEDPETLGRIAVLNARTGAPYVEVDGLSLGMDISLTDRAGWAVALVGPDLGRVGVDLEIVEARTPGFVRDYLTDGEQGFVNDQPSSDSWHAAANLIWSAKEAALKVLRTGLRADTRTVEVTFPDRAGELDSAGMWAPLTVFQRRPLPAVPPQFAHLVVADEPVEEMPGWWRRDGQFLTTMVAPKMLAAPVELPGSADLAAAQPVHSWIANPLVQP